MTDCSAERLLSENAQHQRFNYHPQTAGRLTRDLATTTLCSARGLMPTLTWPEANENIREYLVVSEDADAPFGGKPNVHGIYSLIPASATSLSPSDLQKVDTAAKDQNLLKSGFRVGKNRRNVVYIPCRPPLGHGPHRYFFELVALSENLDPDALSAVPTKEELAELVKGKVVAWGEWCGHL